MHENQQKAIHKWRSIPQARLEKNRTKISAIKQGKRENFNTIKLVKENFKRTMIHEASETRQYHSVKWRSAELVVTSDGDRQFVHVYLANVNITTIGLGQKITHGGEI